MQYWILTSEFPPDSGGGISTYCLHTARMMTMYGVDVTVIVPDGRIHGKTVDELKEGYKVKRFNPGNRPCYENLGYEAAVSFHASEIIADLVEKEGKPDWLESQDFQGLGYYTFQRIRTLDPVLSGIRTVCTSHAPNFLYLEYNQFPKGALPEFFLGELEKSVIRSADITLFPSAFLQQELTTRMKLEDVPQQVLFNPFDTRFVPSNQPITRNDIVFFGKLTPQKGILKLLNYMAELWDKGFEHPLRIIGGGNFFFYPLKTDMIDYIKDKYRRFLDSGHLIFEGHVPPEELHNRLATAHVILVPSITDNLPYTVIESMTQGKVVLASKSGGHQELIEHGKTGFLFEHDHDFETQLNNILALSEKQLKTIGAAAREHVAKVTDYKLIFNQKMAILEGLKKDPSTYRSIAGHQGVIQQHIDDNDLTVIIPYFNMGDLIMETIESVRQSEQAKEILVINDGSTDPESLEILESLTHMTDVRLISKPNTGLADTRNFGAKNSTTRFIAFLDADDMVEPAYYGRAKAILTKYTNLSFVGCWAQYFGASNTVWPTFDPEPPFLLVHNMINSSALVYKREHFISGGLNDREMVYGMEDYESVISLIENGMVGCVIPEPLWKYRIRMDSMAQQFNRYSQLYLYQLIGEKHPKIFSEHALMTNALLNANGPGFLFDNPTKRRMAPGSFKIPLGDSKWLQAAKRNRYLRSVGKKFMKNFTN